ncbi:MAG: hypothetical protein KAU21_21680, partial [Gammaproteobacteria bacterium]|nr:hypothetical protein [Gammaproteobacteria bacterium]
KWLYQLKSAQHPSESRPVTNELILYLLEMNRTSTGNLLYVNTVRTRLLKDGSYAEAVRYQANPSSKARFMREDDQYAMLLLESLKSGSEN